MPGTATHRFVVITLLALFFFPSIPLAGEPGCLLVKQFILIDSIMTGSLQHIDPVKDDSVKLFSVFRDILQQHTGFYAFIIADDRGKIKKTISFEELGSGFSGDISRTEWYYKARKSHASYFGGLLRINGRFCLIWSKPCVWRNALGIKTCRGVVTALVNVGECLKLFSEEFQRPFELAQGRTIFFHSDDWREDVPYLEEPVQLADELTLTLRFPHEGAIEGIGTDMAAPGPMGMNTYSSLPAQSNRNALLKSDHEQIAVSPTALLLLFSLLLAVIALALCIKRLPKMAHAAQKLTALLKAKPQKIELNEDLNTAKRKVMSELYAEVRSRIEKYEIVKMENDVRERLQHDLREQCRYEITDEARERMSASIIEEERGILREKIRKELHANEMAALRNEARAVILQRLQDEIENHETKLLRKELLQKNMIRVSSPVDALAIFEEHQAGPHLTVFTTSGENGVPGKTVKSGNAEIIQMPRADKDE